MMSSPRLSPKVHQKFPAWCPSAPLLWTSPTIPQACLPSHNHIADLVLWLAGNQFFAMDAVISTFENDRPLVKVGLITLPPGLLLEAIEKGGWRYGDIAYPLRPDIYASVNLGHLKRLKTLWMMNAYSVYMHNELQIMVAKGNPMSIHGIDDLGRENIKTSMPNPVNEGIMQFYGRKVLERHGLWRIISANKECVSCQTTERNWFTAVHHRETPERIRTGQSDAGIVWRTEVLEALRDGAPIEGVELIPEDSLRARSRSRDLSNVPAYTIGTGRLRKIWIRQSDRGRVTAKANSLNGSQQPDVSPSVALPVGKVSLVRRDAGRNHLG
jgi:hypothetical protein